MNIQKNEDLLAAQVRLTNAKADIEELKRDKLSGELIEAELVQKEWNEAVLKVKNKLEAIPELAPMLYGLEVSDIKGILRTKVNEIENELAQDNG